MKTSIEELIAMARSLANPTRSRNPTMVILEDMLANALYDQYATRGCAILIEKSDGGRYVVPKLRGVNDLEGEIKAREDAGDKILGYATRRDS